MPKNENNANNIKCIRYLTVSFCTIFTSRLPRMLLKVWFKYLQIYSFWEVNVNLLVHVFDVWGWVFFRSSFWEARCCLGKQWRSWYPFCWKYLSVNYRNSVQRTKGEMSRHVLCIQVKIIEKKRNRFNLFNWCSFPKKCLLKLLQTWRCIPTHIASLRRLWTVRNI